MKTSRLRLVLGAAAAGALALAPARAQQPAPRVKGPRVWLDLDQAALEIIETLASPYGLLGRAVLEQMKLAQG